jgi:hypothetical protein
LFLALVIKIALFAYFDRNITSDRFLQLALGYSIKEGKGYTIPVINATNTSVIEQKRLTFFPPLYSLVAAPILAITHNDYQKT